MTVNRNAGTNEFTIPAGSTIPVAQHAEFLVLAAASGPVNLRVDGSGEFRGLTAGWTYRAPGMDGFTQAEITNPGASAVTVTVQYGWGELKDNRLTVSGTVNITEVAPVETKEVPSDVFSSAASVAAPDGAATLILSADANRKAAILSNEGAGTVYLCAAGASAGEGVPLRAGETREIQTAAAIYARNDSGASVDVARAEVKRS